MAFNEDSRVKIPAILHLMRLGYSYLSLKNANWDQETNIFSDILIEQLIRINKITSTEATKFYKELVLSLENEDLGKAFYEKLTNQSGIKLIDFKEFDKNNTFHVVTELPCINEDEEFRPDITLLINGLPLVFIEVKKPNNKDGLETEKERILRRFSNSKFRNFINITQFMIFSNNMEYDELDLHKVQGAFYASPSYKEPVFNHFREEIGFNLTQLLREISNEQELNVLQDNNQQVIRASKEYQTNKNPDSPTNRILTSLCSFDRLKFFLQYAITYVAEENGLQKHIMRYPQFFATLAIIKHLEEGKKKGIIWHTQGSGKTALSYYNVKVLTNYFRAHNILPKFYFIVDRLDLLDQAKREFRARGLAVNIIESKDDFIREMRSPAAIENTRGVAEITVVNIHKFSEDSTILKDLDYDITIQRIFFLDEVHRSYNPEGSFLANLQLSDPTSVKIGLTGTPLLSKDYHSTDIFGEYIHKYYYNASIADGYTLRLIREEIETNYQIALKQALEEIEVLMGDVDKRQVYAHPSFAAPMLQYIVEDFENFRMRNNDATIGGMVICDSSDQAKMLFEIFNEEYKYKISSENQALQSAAENRPDYLKKRKQNFKPSSARLILHDVGTKQDRKDWIEDFKAGKYDLLFVYNMLLTGFDAKRLKKLYIGRLIKRHNLLQALTRVNRPYKEYRYGHLVDFANIVSEFERTNQDYFAELQAEYGEDEMKNYSDLFKSEEEILQDITEIKENLFRFDTLNKERFSQQINEISNIDQMLQIVKSLQNAKSLYNIIRLKGYDDFLQKLDFKNLNILLTEAQNHLQLLHQRENLNNATETTNLLNVALEDIVFLFTKIGEEELILADELKIDLRRTREALSRNIDKKDPQFISLYEELERLFKKKKLNEVSQEEMRQNITTLRKIHASIKELNRQNALLQEKYQNDPKFCRLHKRIQEKGLSQKEIQIHDILSKIKAEADEKVLKLNSIVDNESYFSKIMMNLVINSFMKEHKIALDKATAQSINQLITQEYFNAFQGVGT